MLNPQDLQRVSAEKAAAVLVLCNKFSSDPSEWETVTSQSIVSPNGRELTLCHTIYRRLDMTTWWHYDYMTLWQYELNQYGDTSCNGESFLAWLRARLDLLSVWLYAGQRGDRLSDDLTVSLLTSAVWCWQAPTDWCWGVRGKTFRQVIVQYIFFVS